MPWLGFPAVARSGTGFQLPVLLVALPPVPWGLVLFFVFRNLRERWGCYASFLAAILPGFVVFEEIRALWMSH